MQFNDRDLELLERTARVLAENTYAPVGYAWSPYRCISPGKSTFPGIWNWDSAFHALGMSRIDVALAKESIFGFFKFQKENGFLPDVIFEDGRIVDNASKPPVFAWAAEAVYRADGDREFLKEIYPKLKNNILWWYGNRHYNGLFFYDAENKGDEDYILTAKYESGWDNSVRWDNGITDLWAIDLNCFIHMSLTSLEFMAAELGIDGDRALWRDKAHSLSSLISSKLWDAENRCYSDVNKFTGKPTGILTPASFMPLFANIASPEKAARMCEIAETKFESKMPTVAFDDPEYSDDYWRGPTWLNVAYFAAKGLKNYGFPVADRIKENILDMCFNAKGGIYENYASVSGKGQCCDRFSWSSVFIREFILNW